MQPSPVPFFVAIAGSLAAQSPAPPSSGPAVGAPLAPIRVFATIGDDKGLTYDAASRFGTSAYAVLFVHELTRNTAPMIRAVDRAATEFGLLGLATATVLLADDRTAAEAQVSRSSLALGLFQPMVVSVDGLDGPGAYGLNRKCTLTLVLGKDGKVTRATGYTDTGTQDTAQLETWLTELCGPRPADRDGWRRLLAARYSNSDAALLDLTATLLQHRARSEQEGARMRGPTRNSENDAARTAQTQGATARKDANAPPPAGKPPTDDELRTLLRASIQRTATADELDEVFRKVAARIGDDAELRRQAVDMFKLVLSLGYGTDAARERAQRFVDTHDGTQAR